MSPFTMIFLTVLGLACFTNAQTTSEPTTADIKAAATQVAVHVRDIVVRARAGLLLDQLLHDVLKLEGEASDLIVLLPEPVSECKTTAVIKMAATGTGSHEVLSVLLAEDKLKVLNGRLALSLALLEQVAMQLEGELSLSDDVGGHLSAIVFGANTTANIVETAGKTLKGMMTTTNNGVNHLNRARRQFDFDLGNGWNVGGGGLTWTSSSGSTSFNVHPTFSSGVGVNAGFTFRF